MAEPIAEYIIPVIQDGLNVVPDFVNAKRLIRCKNCTWFESSTNTCRHFLSSRAPEEFCSRAKKERLSN